MGGISAETIPQGQEAEPRLEKQPEELGSKPCLGKQSSLHQAGARATAPGSSPLPVAPRRDPRGADCWEEVGLEHGTGDDFHSGVIQGSLEMAYVGLQLVYR